MLGGGSDKGQWHAVGAVGLQGSKWLMWVGIAVQFTYIVLVLLQASDLVRPIFAPGVMTAP